MFAQQHINKRAAIFYAERLFLFDRNRFKDKRGARTPRTEFAKISINKLIDFEQDT